MHNSQLTIDSIVVATISEFGQGGIVVVHAVTIMAQTNGVCVITVRNIGLSSMNGRYKLSFVIF
jgi:3-dehydroquinate synthase class II